MVEDEAAADDEGAQAPVASSSSRLTSPSFSCGSARQTAVPSLMSTPSRGLFSFSTSQTLRRAAEEAGDLLGARAATSGMSNSLGVRSCGSSKRSSVYSGMSLNSAAVRRSSTRFSDTACDLVDRDDAVVVEAEAALPEVVAGAQEADVDDDVGQGEVGALEHDAVQRAELVAIAAVDVDADAEIVQ